MHIWVYYKKQQGGSNELPCFIICLLLELISHLVISQVQFSLNR